MVGILGARDGPFGRATFFAIKEPVADHAHPHMHLLFKTGGGDRRLLIEAQPHALTDTQSLLINPWQRHADYPVQSDEASTMLALYIDHGWMAERFGLGDHFGFATPLGPATPLVRKLVAQACAAVTSSEPLAGALEDIIGELVSAAAGSALVDRQVPELSDFRIRRARRKLEEHPHLHVDLGGVARDVGLSRSHFYEQFRSGVGVAPHMFMDALVLEQAYAMMAHSGQSLDQIAKSLGFAAPSSFTRFFRDRVGFPPSSVRRQIEAVAP